VFVSDGEEGYMKKLLFAVAVSAVCLGPAIAQDAKPAVDELAAFRSLIFGARG
jgi:hypothetical protein